MYLKMSSAEVICCKKLPNITDELSIEANSVDPEQTAPVCHRGFLNISADEKSRRLLLLLAHYGLDVHVQLSSGVLSLSSDGIPELKH